jgi:hypothetical protein
MFDESPIRSQSMTNFAVDAAPPADKVASGAAGSSTQPAVAPIDVTPPLAAPPTPAASQVGAGPLASAPPALDAGAADDAGCSAVGCQPVMGNRCSGAGRYGVRFSLDVTYELMTFAGAQPGRGTADVYAWIDVKRVDPQSGALTASGRLCGLALPKLGDDAACSNYQYRFPDKLWDMPSLPSLEVEGSYSCDAASCVLRVDPTEYLLGIHLDDAMAPWPEPGAPDLKQFSDDDADGSPGVSADVTMPDNPAAAAMCGYVPGGAMMTDPAAMRSPRRLLIGLRTDLTASLNLGADCRVAQATGSANAIELRAAGCIYQNAWGGPMQPMQPMQPMAADPMSASCPTELRAAIDGNLPQFHVLVAGEAPSTNDPTRPESASTGPLVRAVVLDANAPADCQQVRDALE